MKEFFLAIIKSKYVFLSLFFIFSCTHQVKNPFVDKPKENRVSVMFYNLENLFDTLKDPGKKDFTYLPLSVKSKNEEAQNYCLKQKGNRKKECLTLNWSNAVMMAKMENLSQVVFQVYDKGPDILMLAEVENENVLKMWNEKFLAKANYSTLVLIEGEDERGIDTALLSRFPVIGKPKLHPIEWNKAAEELPQNTRGILEVVLKLPNEELLTTYTLHLPSQGSPTAFREDGVDTLIKLISKNGNKNWVAGGDWNITYEENEKTGLVSKKLASLGEVSHLVGCKNCRGTHNYRKDWSFLDMLVFSKNMMDKNENLNLVPESITTPKWGKGQTKPSGRPLRFDPEKLRGASDHFPIYAELDLKNPVSKNNRE